MEQRFKSAVQVITDIFFFRIFERGSLIIYDQTHMYCNSRLCIKFPAPRSKIYKRNLIKPCTVTHVYQIKYLGYIKHLARNKNHIYAKIYINSINNCLSTKSVGN